MYGAGGRFIDWWLFGGCVYVRSLLFIWDWCFGGSSDGEEFGGENVFACFGVAAEEKKGGNSDAKSQIQKKPQDV